jgi:hypothetical protein
MNTIQSIGGYLQFGVLPWTWPGVVASACLGDNPMHCTKLRPSLRQRRVRLRKASVAVQRSGGGGRRRRTFNIVDAACDIFLGARSNMRKPSSPKSAIVSSVKPSLRNSCPASLLKF